METYTNQPLHFPNCKFNYNVNDLRKAISSNCIASRDMEKITKLEYIQGHSLDVILNNYNIYTKKKTIE